MDTHTHVHTHTHTHTFLLRMDEQLQAGKGWVAASGTHIKVCLGKQGFQPRNERPRVAGCISLKGFTVNKLCRI